MWCNTDPKLRFELLKLVKLELEHTAYRLEDVTMYLNGRQQVVLKMWSLLLKVENKTDI